MASLTIMIKPASGACNMHCTYCFYADVRTHRSVADYGIMSLQTLEKIVRRAFLYADESVSFSFQGGEPTLAGLPFFEKLLVFERMYNTRSIPVYNSIQTNGYELNNDWIRIFREGHFLVGISLDGIGAIHDQFRKDHAGRATYDRICANIQKLREAKIDYNILCVINHEIAAHPAEVFTELQKHRYLQFIPCLNGFDGHIAPWSLVPGQYGRFLIETYDLYEQRIKNNQYISVRTFDNWINMIRGYPPESCGMSGRCGNYYLIEADGSVYPCDFYVIDQWRLGNITMNNFKTLAASETGKAFCTESLPIPETCRQCHYYPLCRNGCKREREPYPDENNIPRTIHCAQYKAFFDARLGKMRHLAKWIEKHYRKV